MNPAIEQHIEPCIARLETHWHAPWLVGAMTHQGAWHYTEGMPNQDAFAIGKAGRATWLALSDGVSQKPLSHVGSALATRWVGDYLADKLATTPPSQRMLTMAVEAVRKRLGAHAGVQGKPINDYACTLLVAVLTEKSITVAKIGDGSVFAVESYRDGVGLASLVDSPHVGEGVVDLTHQAWKSHLRVRHLADRTAPPIHTVALSTDGANPYFFKTVHVGDEEERRGALNPELVGPQLARQLEARTPRNFIGYLASLMFLKPHVDEADDKTLLVATIPAKAPPCSNTTA